MKKSCVLSLLSLVFVLACESNHTEKSGGQNSGLCVDGIIGGTNVSNQDPFSKKVVMLYGSDGGICTATPIGRNILLTAAHCVKGVAQMKAILSAEITCSSGFNLSKSSIDVVSRIVHEDYDESSLKGSDVKKYRGDLAVLKLARPLPANYEISALYDGGFLDSFEVTLVGYGKENENSTTTSRLRTAKKTLDQLSSFSNGEDKIVMDQRDGLGLCNGDSGGPQFILSGGQYKILGVNAAVSGDTKDQQCHKIGYTMSVPYYRQWIEQAVKILR